MQVSDTIKDLFLDTLIDVEYKHLHREPMRIIERKINQGKGTISIKAEMVNFPYVVINRDKTPPIPVTRFFILNLCW